MGKRKQLLATLLTLVMAINMTICDAGLVFGRTTYLDTSAFVLINELNDNVMYKLSDEEYNHIYDMVYAETALKGADRDESPSFRKLNKRDYSGISDWKFNNDGLNKELQWLIDNNIFHGMGEQEWPVSDLKISEQKYIYQNDLLMNLWKSKNGALPTYYYKTVGFNRAGSNELTTASSAQKNLTGRGVGYNSLGGTPSNNSTYWDESGLGANFIGDIAVYADPNVYDNYKAKFVSFFENGETLLGNPVSTYNTLVPGDIVEQVQVTDRDAETICYRDFIDLVAMFLRVYDKEISDEELSLLEFKFNLGRYFAIPKEEARNFYYLIALGILPQDSDILRKYQSMDMMVTWGDWIDIEYRIANVEARYTWKVIQLTDSETEFQQLGYFEDTVKLYTDGSFVSDGTAFRDDSEAGGRKTEKAEKQFKDSLKNYVEESAIVTDVSDDSWSDYDDDDLESIPAYDDEDDDDEEDDEVIIGLESVTSFVRELFEPVTVHAESTKTFKVVKYFTAEAYDDGSITYTCDHIGTIKLNELTNEKDPYFVDEVERKSIDVDGKSVDYVACTWRVQTDKGGNATTAQLYVDNKVHYGGKMSKTISLSGFSKVYMNDENDETLYKVTLVSKTELQKIPDIVILSDRLLMNSRTGAYALIGGDDQFSLVGSMIYSSSQEPVLYTASTTEVYYNLGTILGLIGNSNLKKIGLNSDSDFANEFAYRSLNTEKSVTTKYGKTMTASVGSDKTYYSLFKNAKYNDNTKDKSVDSRKKIKNKSNIFYNMTSVTKGVNSLAKTVYPNDVLKDLGVRKVTVIADFVYVPALKLNEPAKTGVWKNATYDTLYSKLLDDSSTDDYMTAMLRSNKAFSNVVCDWFYEDSRDINFIESGYVGTNLTFLIDWDQSCREKVTESGKQVHGGIIYAKEDYRNRINSFGTDRQLYSTVMDEIFGDTFEKSLGASPATAIKMYYRGKLTVYNDKNEPITVKSGNTGKKTADNGDVFKTFKEYCGLCIAFSDTEKDDHSYIGYYRPENTQDVTDDSGDIDMHLKGTAVAVENPAGIIYRSVTAPSVENWLKTNIQKKTLESLVVKTQLKGGSGDSDKIIGDVGGRDPIVEYFSDTNEAILFQRISGSDDASYYTPMYYSLSKGKADTSILDDWCAATKLTFETTTDMNDGNHIFKVYLGTSAENDFYNEKTGTSISPFATTDIRDIANALWGSNPQGWESLSGSYITKQDVKKKSSIILYGPKEVDCDDEKHYLAFPNAEVSPAEFNSSTITNDFLFFKMTNCECEQNGLYKYTFEEETAYNYVLRDDVNHEAYVNTDDTITVNLLPKYIVYNDAAALEYKNWHSRKLYKEQTKAYDNSLFKQLPFTPYLRDRKIDPIGLLGLNMVNNYSLNQQIIDAMVDKEATYTKLKDLPAYTLLNIGEFTWYHLGDGVYISEPISVSDCVPSGKNYDARLENFVNGKGAKSAISRILSRDPVKTFSAGIGMFSLSECIETCAYGDGATLMKCRDNKPLAALRGAHRQVLSLYEGELKMVTWLRNKDTGLWGKDGGPTNIRSVSSVTGANTVMLQFKFKDSVLDNMYARPLRSDYSVWELSLSSGAALANQNTLAIFSNGLDILDESESLVDIRQVPNLSSSSFEGSKEGFNEVYKGFVLSDVKKLLMRVIALGGAYFTCWAWILYFLFKSKLLIATDSKFGYTAKKVNPVSVLTLGFFSQTREVTAKSALLTSACSIVVLAVAMAIL